MTDIILDRVYFFTTPNDNIPVGTICVPVEIVNGSTVKVKRYDTNEIWEVQREELEEYTLYHSCMSGEEYNKYTTYIPDDDDMVNHPKHYNLLPGIEVIDVLDALCKKWDESGNDIDSRVISYYCQAVGYLMRMMDKNGIQDAKKAVWYINRMVKIMEGGKDE